MRAKIPGANNLVITQKQNDDSGLTEETDIMAGL